MKTNAARNTATSAPQPSRSTIATRRVALVADANGATSASIWEPGLTSLSAIPTTDEVLNRRPPLDAIPADLERTIVSVLTRPLRADETHVSGNENRERELKAIFSHLGPIQALQLRRRLDVDRDSDPIAVAFRRIVVERRMRLRAFLADPRRLLIAAK